MQRYLVVGLGNPGSEYEFTRHNIGFGIVNVLAGSERWENDKLGWLCEVSHRGRKATVLKPTTYMNLSGQAVRYHLQRLGLKPSEMIVIADDIALDFGTLRLKPKGSDGGHNGLKSITELLGTEAYPRLRVGVGSNFVKGQQADYVLSGFSSTEMTHLALLKEAGADCIKHFMFHGMDAAMNRFNRDVLAPPKDTKPPKPSPGTNNPHSLKDS